MSAIAEGKVLVTNHQDLSEGRANSPLPALPASTHKQNILVATAGTPVTVTGIPASAKFCRVAVIPDTQRVAFSVDVGNPASFPTAGDTSGDASEVDPVVINMLDESGVQHTHLSLDADTDATIANLVFYS